MLNNSCPHMYGLDLDAVEVEGTVAGPPALPDRFLGRQGLQADEARRGIMHPTGQLLPNARKHLIALLIHPFPAYMQRTI